MKPLQAGAEASCLEGAIDAARAGMRAVVRKDHFYSTVGEAWAVQQHVDHLVETGALPRPVAVYGGVPITFSLDHPLSSFTTAEIAELAGGGVYVGLFCYPSLPSMIKAPVVDPHRTQEVLERVGAERCIVANDVGMLLEPTAVEALRLMVRLLLGLGLAPDQIDLMLKRNPARLIGLTEGSGADVS